MKRTIPVEQTTCDFCKKDGAYYKCLGCGKDICWQCASNPKVGKTYNFSVHFSGSDDGHYCLECDNQLRRRGNPLHSAYLVIEALKNEEGQFYTDFQRRAKEAEVAVKSNQPKT